MQTVSPCTFTWEQSLLDLLLPSKLSGKQIPQSAWALRSLGSVLAPRSHHRQCRDLNHPTDGSALRGCCCYEGGWGGMDHGMDTSSPRVESSRGALVRPPACLTVLAPGSGPTSKQQPQPQRLGCLQQKKARRRRRRRHSARPSLGQSVHTEGGRLSPPLPAWPRSQRLVGGRAAGCCGKRQTPNAAACKRSAGGDLGWGGGGFARLLLLLAKKAPAERWGVPAGRLAPSPSACLLQPPRPPRPWLRPAWNKSSSSLPSGGN